MTQDEITATVEAIIAAATIAEKVDTMSGKGFSAQYGASGGVWAANAYRAGGRIERPGAPAFYFSDGPAVWLAATRPAFPARWRATPASISISNAVSAR